jgi:hypothetical protein
MGKAVGRPDCRCWRSRWRAKVLCGRRDKRVPRSSRETSRSSATSEVQGSGNRGSDHCDRSNATLSATPPPDLNPTEELFPYSSRGTAKRPNEKSMLYGRKSGNCSIQSPPANAQTTSPLAEMRALKSKPL